MLRRLWWQKIIPASCDHLSQKCLLQESFPILSLLFCILMTVFYFPDCINIPGLRVAELSIWLVRHSFKLELCHLLNYCLPAPTLFWTTLWFWNSDCKLHFSFDKQVNVRPCQWRRLEGEWLPGGERKGFSSCWFYFLCGSGKVLAIICCCDLYYAFHFFSTFLKLTIFYLISNSL